MPKLSFTRDIQTGDKNCARYSAAEISGMTVVAAALPTRIDASEIIKGIPIPLAKPIQAEPNRVPLQPPRSASKR